MTDRYGVIWTQVRGTPEKLADMVFTDTQLRITKTADAMAAKVPGVSLLHDLAGDRQMVYDRVESRAFPPQLLALLPPVDSANPQRRILQALLERHRPVKGMQSAMQQWEMLLFAGRNGIGHLDVFEHDDLAKAYYTGKSGVLSSQKETAGSELWFAFRRFVERTANEDEENAVIETIGPTPGVSGFVPKLMAQVSLGSNNDWSGTLFGKNSTPAIIKIEQALYPGLLALEELAYDYHRRAKVFNVPRTWLKTINHQGESITLLAAERFDRVDGRALPQESFFSLLHSGNRNKYQCNTDGSMEDLAKIFTVTGLPIEQKEEWFKRFVMSVLTGNGDLHTENMAIVGGASQHQLAPLYDPAPMRAYRGRASHNILSALPFSGVGGVAQTPMLPYASSGETPPHLGKLLIEFGRAAGIHARRSKTFISELADVTKDFCDEATAVLEALPASARKNSLAPAIDGFRATLREVRSSVLS